MFHTLRGLLRLMAGVTLLGMLLLGGMAIYTARTGAENLHAVNAQAVVPRSLLHSVEQKVKEIRFRIAGVALGQLPTVGSANHLKEVQAVLPAEWANFYAIASTPDLPKEEKENLDKINEGMKLLESLMGSLMTAYQNDEIDKVKSILEDDWPSIHAKVIKPLEKLLPYYEGLAQAAFDRADSNARRMTALVSILLIAVLGVVGAGSFYMLGQFTTKFVLAKSAVNSIASLDLSQNIQVEGRDEISQLLEDLSVMQSRMRDMVREVRDGARSLEHMSSELAGASNQVASASTSQAELASGMAASVEELSVSIDQMSGHATESNSLAMKSGEASRQGREITQSAAHEMAAIAEGARHSSDIVSELGGLSSDISSIVNVIKEIADQTNLLALNAAIEAARAGEQGRGFAVVADEVRKLAERTSSSTQQISEMIQRIQSGTRRAVEAMESDVARANQGEKMARRAGESIDQIEQRASDVVRSVNEIQLALREQSASAKDVAARVEKIAQMTETNSSASLQTSTAANRVSSLAAKLNTLMASFRV